MENSCYQCLDRSIYCHDKCERYKLFVKEKQDIKANKHDEYSKYMFGKVSQENEVRMRLGKKLIGKIAVF